MAPANDQVFSRRNHQIQDAIDGQNLKQALQLIEKRMKKGEDTRFLKVSLMVSCSALDTATLTHVVKIISSRHGKHKSSSDMRMKPIVSAVLPRLSSCAMRSQLQPT
jgi:hypothetical protein